MCLECHLGIFRYNNALHHAEVSPFPHHKHEGGDIKESPEIILYQVLLEIAHNQRWLFNKMQGWNL